VVTLNPAAAESAMRKLCADLSGLLRAVGFRDLEGGLSCVLGIGSDAWDRLFGAPRPKDLHPFREIRGSQSRRRHARRPALPHPRHAHGPLFRACNAS
jgi:deferrochelatase/peroxidase EfeB